MVRARRTEAISWERAAETYLLEKRRANLAQGTLDSYRWVLLGERTTAWRARLGPALSDVTADAVREFEADLATTVSHRGTLISAATVSLHHRAIKSFLRWCAEEGYTVAPRVATLKGPRVPLVTPEALTEDEERRVLKACRSERDRFLVTLMVRTGLRAAEVCSLTLDDVISGPQGAYLHVRQGKGRKDRIVPLDTRTQRLSRELRAYTREVRPDTACRHLFVTLTRTVGEDHRPLKTAGLKLVFRRLAGQSGVHVHAHKLRHTFASRAVANGVDVLTLQRVLGHTNVAMTSRYVHSDPASILRSWSRLD